MSERTPLFEETITVTGVVPACALQTYPPAAPAPAAGTAAAGTVVVARRIHPGQVQPTPAPPVWDAEAEAEAAQRRAAIALPKLARAALRVIELGLMTSVVLAAAGRIWSLRRWR